MNRETTSVTSRPRDRRGVREGGHAEGTGRRRARMLVASVLGAVALTVLPAGAALADGHVDRYDVASGTLSERYASDAGSDGLDVIPSH